MQGKLAYHSSRNAKPKSESVELFLKEIFFAGRESHIRFSYKSQKRYIETNNGITFFAPVLAKIFPEAKFVHLIRPPLEFIVSGLKRNYYSGSAEDIKRISTDIIFDEWKSTSQITKIAWLWHATNKFIMDFEKQYPCRIMVFPFQELNLKNVRSVIDFLELSIADKSIQKEISKPVNVQKAGKAKSYENWGLKQKEEVRNLCRDIVNELNVKYE
ncbi:MAG: sulfotransferase [Balneolaceae bacterium]